MARSITDIQADLDAAYAARKAALAAQLQSVDSGQGKHMVQRANLTEIRKQIQALELELEDAQSTAGGYPAAQSLGAGW